MSGQAQSRRFESQTDALAFEKIATFSRMRVLAWAREDLYASRGYEIFSVTPGKSLVWRSIAEFHAPAWRRLTSGVPLASRLFRDGFHALCVLPSGSLIGAVPGAIVTCPSGENTFHVTHVIQRGTRPITLTEGKFIFIARVIADSRGMLLTPSLRKRSVTSITSSLIAGRTAYGSSLATMDTSVESCEHQSISRTWNRCWKEISKHERWLSSQLQRGCISLPTRHLRRIRSIA